MNNHNNHVSTSLILKYLQVIFITALILYFGRTLFIPLFFGLLIAIVMYPVARWLESKGWGRAMAITICLLIIIILFSALLYLLVWQINVFRIESAGLLLKLEEALAELQAWVNEHSGIPLNVYSNWEANFSQNLGNVIRDAVQATFSTMFTIFMVPVFIALFLYHRAVFVKYLQSITPAEYRSQLNSTLQQTIHTYFNYIKGMILVYLVVGVLNSAGLWALGVKHPLLFGMICAIMTIIPYIGIIISALLPISLVWLETDNILYPIGVIVLFAFVQYLEANVIFPKIVGAQLNVSTMAMLVAIIVGGIIWGAAGMVLFIPFVAMLKIASDRLPGLTSLNILLSRN